MTDKVYFIASADHIKIGFSANVNDRLRKLSTQNVLPFTVIGIIDGSKKLERAIHHKLAEHRNNGEWFSDCDAVRSVVNELMDRGADAIDYIEQQAEIETASPSLEGDDGPCAYVSPLRPFTRRLEICMERYIGEHIHEYIKKESALGLPAGSLVDHLIGGHYTHENAITAAQLMRHALDCLDMILPPLLDVDLKGGDPGSYCDLIARANCHVTHLELSLQRLFENPAAPHGDSISYVG